MAEAKKEENSEEKQETKHSDIPKAPIDEEAEAEKAAADTNDGVDNNVSLMTHDKLDQEFLDTI